MKLFANKCFKIVVYANRYSTWFSHGTTTNKNNNHDSVETFKYHTPRPYYYPQAFVEGCARDVERYAKKSFSTNKKIFFHSVKFCARFQT